MRKFQSLSAASVLLVTSSCDLTGPQETTVREYVSFYNDVSPITIPDTVTAGSAFEVRVDTFGGSCRLNERTETTVSGMMADVVVYDLDTGDRVCTAILIMNPHRATIAFPQPGIGTVWFHGWRAPENTSFVLERTVVVRQAMSSGDPNCHLVGNGCELYS